MGSWVEGRCECGVKARECALKTPPVMTARSELPYASFPAPPAAHKSDNSPPGHPAVGLLELTCLLLLAGLDKHSCARKSHLLRRGGRASTSPASSAWWSRPPWASAHTTSAGSAATKLIKCHTSTALERPCHATCVRQMSVSLGTCRQPILRVHPDGVCMPVVIFVSVCKACTGCVTVLAGSVSNVVHTTYSDHPYG